MVLCLLALPLFLILGIFSIKYRRLAADAFNCLVKTVTLRKCESGLDDRIRSQITGHVLKFSPRLARLVYRHYKIWSWIFLALLIWSTYATGVGLYNFYLYGSCKAPEDTGFCPFDPTGTHTGISKTDADILTGCTAPVLEDDDIILGNPNASLTIIEFGCYTCEYTKTALPIVNEVLDYYKGKVNFQFKTFSIPQHALSRVSALAADCAQEQGKVLEYHTGLLSNQITEEFLSQLAKDVGLDVEKFNACLAEEKYAAEVDADTVMGMHAGVVGTPTFFINGKKIVGPKPFKTFKTIIDEELENV